MEPQRKLSLKRVEISLTKFNEVAVPHHLDLLRQHKNNIIKFAEAGELRRVQSEQINARRIVGQLRHLLSDMEQLRIQVRPEDIEKFDKRTEQSRSKTLKAIRDYLERPPFQDIPTPKQETCMPLASVQSTLSTDSIGTVLTRDVQLVVDQTELQNNLLEHKQNVATGWEELQRDLQDLHDVYMQFNTMVERQRAEVESVSDNVELSAVNVDIARRTLAKAERLKVTMYPLAGAVVGGCLAGPVGLIAGFKVASAALIGGTILGFTGGSILKRKQEVAEGTPLTDLNAKETGREDKKDI